MTPGCKNSGLHKRDRAEWGRGVVAGRLDCVPLCSILRRNEMWERGTVGCVYVCALEWEDKRAAGCRWRRKEKKEYDQHAVHGDAFACWRPHNRLKR